MRNGRKELLGNWSEETREIEPRTRFVLSMGGAHRACSKRRTIESAFKLRVEKRLEFFVKRGKSNTRISETDATVSNGEFIIELLIFYDTAMTAYTNEQRFVSLNITIRIFVTILETQLKK